MREVILLQDFHLLPLALSLELHNNCSISCPNWETDLFTCQVLWIWFERVLADFVVTIFFEYLLLNHQQSHNNYLDAFSDNRVLVSA